MCSVCWSRLSASCFYLFHGNQWKTHHISIMYHRLLITSQVWGRLWCHNQKKGMRDWQEKTGRNATRKSSYATTPCSPGTSDASKCGYTHGGLYSCSLASLIWLFSWKPFTILVCILLQVMKLFAFLCTDCIAILQLTSFILIDDFVQAEVPCSYHFHHLKKTGKPSQTLKYTFCGELNMLNEVAILFSWHPYLMIPYQA